VSYLSSYLPKLDFLNSSPIKAEVPICVYTGNVGEFLIFVVVLSETFIPTNRIFRYEEPEKTRLYEIFFD
jgi:hypothetical protein